MRRNYSFNNEMIIYFSYQNILYCMVVIDATLLSISKEGCIFANKCNSFLYFVSTGNCMTTLCEMISPIGNCVITICELIIAIFAKCGRYMLKQSLDYYMKYRPYTPKPMVS